MEVAKQLGLVSSSCSFGLWIVVICSVCLLRGMVPWRRFLFWGALILQFSFGLPVNARIQLFSIERNSCATRAAR